LPELARALLLVAAVVAVYMGLRKLTGRVIAFVGERVGSTSFPLRDVEGAVAVAFYGVNTTLLFLLFSPLTDLDRVALWTRGLRPSYLLAGLALGVGQASFTLMVTSYVLRPAFALRYHQVGDAALSEHQLLGRTGWIRAYHHAAEVLRPRPLAYGVIGLALTGEELLFRGLLIPLLAPLGPLVAVLGSTALFIVIQIPDLPSWYQSVPPVCGAVVVGLVHGSLFLMVPTLPPLVVSHLVFFLILLL
jgi:Type II CAAX prenyl endopeptidase Rce1-like